LIFYVLNSDCYVYGSKQVHVVLSFIWSILTPGIP